MPFVLIDKIWVAIICLLLFFTAPLVLRANKVDSTTEDYAADAVNEFVNKCCATGIITSSAYEEMVNRLDSTGITYDIYLIHSNEAVAPKVTEDGQVEMNEYVQYYDEYRNDEIYETLFPEDGEPGMKKYYLNEGDYVRVVIENNTPTLGRRLAGMFTLNVSDTPSIMVSRGDYVGHEVFIR